MCGSHGDDAFISYQVFAPRIPYLVEMVALQAAAAAKKRVSWTFCGRLDTCEGKLRFYRCGSRRSSLGVDGFPLSKRPPRKKRFLSRRRLVPKITFVYFKVLL